MSNQAAALRDLSQLIEQHAIDIQFAARRAGFSVAAAWRAADVVGMGTMLALGGNPAEAFEFALADLFEPAERRDITSDDYPAVNRHMAALRDYMRRLPSDHSWRARPKRRFADWPEHCRPKFRLSRWPEAANG